RRGTRRTASPEVSTGQEASWLDCQIIASCASHQLTGLRLPQASLELSQRQRVKETAVPMADDRIRYDILVQEAARGVIRKVLQETAQAGLPGEHHFFITFVTSAPGVRISSALRERYPEQMTI